MIDVVCLWIGRVWLGSLAATAAGLALGWLAAAAADRIGRRTIR